MQEKNTSSDEDHGQKDARRAWVVAVLVAVLGIALTLPFVGAPPPRTISVATGPAGGGYARAGRHLARSLQRSGIRVELRETAGSGENLALLSEGAVDLAFAQGGVYELRDMDDESVEEQEPELVGLASLYYEPLWIFTRGGEAVTQLDQLAGMRIQVGAAGSGTRAVSLAMLGSCGATPAGERLLGESPEQAIESLLAGQADAVFLVTSPNSPGVKRLFELADEGSLHAVSLARAHSLSRHFRYLRPLELTPGLIDLAQDLPAESVQIVAPTAGLLARAELHPALAPLVIGAMQERFGRGQLFEQEGEFPSPLGLDVPVSLAAERYYANGRSFLYRIFPFQLAAALDRLKILLLPLITLLLPLVRVAPPLYRWRVRSKIFRWYQTIMGVEARLREQPEAADFERAEAELETLEDELRNVSVPLSYAEELYNVRMHARLVRRDVAARLHGS